MGLDFSNMRETLHTLLLRNNAQSIREELASLEELRSRYRTRWLYELLQNARDASPDDREITVEVSLAGGVLTFRHDGRPFTQEEVVSLIVHGSTKPASKRDAGNPLLGRFGTGFLATHLLSLTVLVRGSIAGADGTPAVGFEFVLDRTGDTDAELSDSIDRSYEAFVASATSESRAPTQWTEFRYQLGPEADAVTQALQLQLLAVPYILAFNDPIGCLRVTGEACPPKTFQRQLADSAIADGRLVTVDVMCVEEPRDSVRLAVFQSDGIRVATRASSSPNGAGAFEAPGDVPRLFLFLPLVGTNDLGLPVVLHSAEFAPTASRDGLYVGAEEAARSTANRRALERCATAIVGMVERSSEAGWQNVHRLLRLEATKTAALPGDDAGWFRALQRSLLERLAEVPAIETSHGGLVPLGRALIAVGGEPLPTSELHRFSRQIFGDPLVAERISAECAGFALGWEELLSATHELSGRVILRAPRLVAKVIEHGGVGGLAGLFDGHQAAALAWLNELVAAWPLPDRLGDLDGLLPDQTGTFRKNAALSRDAGLDDALKNLQEMLGTPIRTGLLHLGIAAAQELLEQRNVNDDLILRIKELLKQQATEASKRVPEFRDACILFFGWLTQRMRWDHLKDSLPVLTLERDGKEGCSKTATKDPRLLYPRALWPAPARELFDAMPGDSVLADAYTGAVPSDAWQTLAANSVVIGRLSWTERVQIGAQHLSTFSTDVDDDGEHIPKSTQEVEVGYLALVGTDELTTALKSSKQRSARFMRFVLEYAIHAEGSWKQRVQVPCSCGKTHVVIPCDWLWWMRRTHWVPRGNQADPISTEALARLATTDPALSGLVTRADAQDFLDAAGINVLEQTLLLRGDSERAEYRRKLAQLSSSLKAPSDIDLLVRDVEARQRLAEWWEQNQEFGRRIEVLVQQLLDQAPKLDVVVRFTGHDLEARVKSDAQPADIGALEVGATKIEIKATRGDSVSMSGVQAATATADSDHFWLCVFPLDPTEAIGSIDEAMVRERLRFVQHIGQKLSASRSELDDATTAALSEGIELEHLDEVRYRVKRSVWESSGVSLADFIATLVA